MKERRMKINIVTLLYCYVIWDYITLVTLPGGFTTGYIISEILFSFCVRNRRGRGGGDDIYRASEFLLYYINILYI